MENFRKRWEEEEAKREGREERKEDGQEEEDMDAEEVWPNDEYQPIAVFD